MSWGVGRRCGWDLALLWPWGRPAAVAPMGPLAWEPPNAVGAALKKKKKKKKKAFYGGRWFQTYGDHCLPYAEVRPHGLT